MSAPTTAAARRLTSKRKSADANDLEVDDSKQVRLRAYPASIFGCFNAAWYQGGIGWNILSSLLQLFAFLAAILNLKLEEAGLSRNAS